LQGGVALPQALGGTSSSILPSQSLSKLSHCSGAVVQDDIPPEPATATLVDPAALALGGCDAVPALEDDSDAAELPALVVMLALLVPAVPLAFVGATLIKPAVPIPEEPVTAELEVAAPELPAPEGCAPALPPTPAPASAPVRRHRFPARTVPAGQSVLQEAARTAARTKSPTVDCDFFCMGVRVVWL
jgi:hypothetical protein